MRWSSPATAAVLIRPLRCVFIRSPPRAVSLSLGRSIPQNPSIQDKCHRKYSGQYEQDFQDDPGARQRRTKPYPQTSCPSCHPVQTNKLSCHSRRWDKPALQQ
jgi:hypothetical protein